jgi:hypothetical protein
MIIFITETYVQKLITSFLRFLIYISSYFHHK